MTEHPESSGNPYPPPAAAPPPAGGPNPYSYPPGPAPGPYPGAYPPPPMPYGNYPGGAPTVMRNGLGVAALITGLLALFGSWTAVFGLALGGIAIIMGIVARRRVKRGEASNGGVALGGILLGALAILISVAFIVLGTWVFKEAGGSDFFDCISNAGNDTVQTDRCTADFEQRVADLFGQSDAAG